MTIKNIEYARGMVRKELIYCKLDSAKCHDGEPKIDIAPSEYNPNEFVGNIRCTCSKPIFVVRGKIDGSNINFDNVPEL